MIQLHTITNPYLSLEKGQKIPWEFGGITSIKLKLSRGSYHQLELTVNSKLGDLYDFLISENFAGLRIDQEDGLSLGFIKQPQDLKQVNFADGQSNIKFYSTSYMLNNVRAYPRRIPIGSYVDQGYRGFLQSINEKINFSFLTPTRNIKMYTGAFNSAALLQEVVKQAGNFSWLDRGIQDGKIYIEIGNLADKPINPDLLATNLFESSSITDSNTVIINDAPTNVSGEVISHILPIGNRGGGSDPSNSVLITSKNKTQVTELPDYPLVDSGQITAKGEKIFMVQNGTYNLNYEYGEEYVVNLEEFQEDLTLKGGTLQKLYTRTVNFLRGKSTNERRIFDLTFNKIVLPGEKVQVEFRSRKQDGSVYAISESTFFTDIEYSLNDFQRFLNF